MKVDHAFSDKAALSVFIGEQTGRICLTFIEPSGERAGESISVWLSRAKFGALTVEAAQAASEADRIAAAKRGEAVPAAPMSDGEAATAVLRLWVEARITHDAVQRNSDIMGTRNAIDDERRAFLAAAAFLKIPVSL